MIGGKGVRWVLECVLGLLVSGGWGLSAAEPTHQLRYQFPQGETLNYVSQHDARYKITFQSSKENVSHTSMSVRTIRVLNSTPEVAQVEHTIQQARMTADNGQGTTVYESARPNDVPPDFERVHQSIGKPLSARLSPQGKTLAATPGADSLENAELFFQLPEGPVAVGAQWAERYESQIVVEEKLFKKIRMERRFQLMSVENGVATIGLATVCLSPMNDPAQEVQVLQKAPKGQFRLELATGRLLERQLVIDDNVVAFQGPGTQMEVKSIRVDRLISPEQVAQVDLTKPLIPVTVAEDATPKQ
ncbi:MAG: hypothetical protein DWH91_10105 [Planctomycetota bacterium]|nr:MAG: hypothetical protein DWH91_10105 [Planctomycetota bacterium]